MPDVKYVVSVDSKKAVREIKKVDASIDGMKTQAKKSISPLKGMFGQLALGAGAVIAVRAAFKGLVGFMGDATGAAIEQERVTAALEAVLKSTGGAAGLTAAELIKMSDEMQSLTTYSNEEVQAAENLLLTFTKIGKDVFPDTLETVLDMSTALGQDLKSSAVQLGKALNDPIEGVTALKRVGVNFTDAQRDQIKVLVESGNQLGAQNLILKELQVEFGGAAKAAADTFGGSLKQLGNYWDDLKKAVGEAIIENETINELIGDLKDNVVELIESGKLKEWVDGALDSIINLGKAIATLIDYSSELPKTGLIGFFEEAVNKIIGLDDELKSLEMEARMRAVEFRDSLEILKPTMEDVRDEFEKGKEKADAYMLSMKDQDARLSANKEAYIKLSGEIFKAVGLIGDNKKGNEDLKPTIDNIKISTELLTTSLKGYNRELEIVFENIDVTLPPAYREWSGLAYNTQEEIKTHVFNANDEIVTDTETTIGEISPLWDGLGTDISRSFGNAFEDILTEGSDLSDAMVLLIGGLKDSIIGFFGDMVTGFLKNNVFSAMSSAATSATSGITDALGGLFSGGGGGGGAGGGGLLGGAGGAAGGIWTGVGAAAGTLLAGLITGTGVSKQTGQDQLFELRQIKEITRDYMLVKTQDVVNHTLRIAVQTEGVPPKIDTTNRILRDIRKNFGDIPSGQGGLDFQSGGRGGLVRYHPNEQITVKPNFNQSFQFHNQIAVIEKPTQWVIKVVQDNLNRNNIRVPASAIK